MDKNIFITGIAGISAQTEEAIFSEKPYKYSKNIFSALSPDFKEYIPAMALRRMSTAIKMGLTAGKIALKDADVQIPDAIITGTGEGCKQDTEKFLESVLLQNEELITPTSFIQSTHNTVGGQIALNLKCTGYNVTYTQESTSLESAFFDAQLLFREQPKLKSVLVGGVDEVSKKITSFGYLTKFLKQKEIENLDLFSQHSPGTITSEGAFFFNLSTKNQDNSYAILKGVKIFKAETAEEITAEINNYLEKKESKIENIDAVILGRNGDLDQDKIYDELQNMIFSKNCILAYKHLVGDFNTVTGFALWLTCKIFKKQEIPNILRLNSVDCNHPKNVLLYNMSSKNNHSLILLQKP